MTSATVKPSNSISYPWMCAHPTSRPPCLFSHHTCSGALKYGLQEWLPSTFYDDLIAPCVRKKVWKILGRECKPVRYLARFLETYPLFYDERCHWDLGLWILTKHGLRSEKHWNLWSLWKRFQEQSGMTDFRILCFATHDLHSDCRFLVSSGEILIAVMATFCHHSVCSTINCILYCCLNLIHQTNWQK